MIKKPKSKSSLKDKIQDRRKKLKERSAKSNLIFLKADTTLRVRLLNVGEENEFLKEVVTFYLGGEIKGIISPATFGEPCAIMEEYERLKKSKKADDKDLAKKLTPKSKFIGLVGVYKDLKGKEIDKENSGKCIQLTQGLYEETTDLYLDEDDWGDMTSLTDGYDLKYKRTGSGKNDTEYSVQPCSKTPCPKEWKKVWDLDKEIRKLIPSYEETEALLEQYLGSVGDTDEEEEEAPKKKGLKTKGSKFKKHKSDLDE